MTRAHMCHPTTSHIPVPPHPPTFPTSTYTPVLYLHGSWVAPTRLCLPGVQDSRFLMLPTL